MLLKQSIMETVSALFVVGLPHDALGIKKLYGTMTVLMTRVVILTVIRTSRESISITEIYRFSPPISFASLLERPM